MLTLFLAFDIVCAICTVVTHMFAVVATEESEKFYNFWKGRIFGKLGRKRLEACMNLNIWLGSVFSLKRSTLLNTVSEVVNTTVTLLLLD